MAQHRHLATKTIQRWHPCWLFMITVYNNVWCCCCCECRGVWRPVGTCGLILKWRTFLRSLVWMSTDRGWGQPSLSWIQKTGEHIHNLFKVPYCIVESQKSPHGVWTPQDWLLKELTCTRTDLGDSLIWKIPLRNVRSKLNELCISHLNNIIKRHIWYKGKSFKWKWDFLSTVSTNTFMTCFVLSALN